LTSSEVYFVKKQLLSRIIIDSA